MAGTRPASWRGSKHHTSRREPVFRGSPAMAAGTPDSIEIPYPVNLLSNGIRMNKVLIIGAGGVGNVVAHKCAQVPEVFAQIMLASRTLSKCEAIRNAVAQRTGRRIEVAQVDADDVAQTTALIDRYKPDLVLNVALPYQDLHLMEACLAAGVDYLDTANYEQIGRAHV